MDYGKVLGIIFIILGLLFIVYPFYSAAAVSLIAGICLIVFGFASIISGFSIWSMMAHVSVINIILGILAMLLGFLFIYEIDALSFILAYQFFLIAFVMILFGIFGVISGPDALSKVTSGLIFILGLITVVLAFYSIAQPLYAAIFVGICLVLEGIAFFASGYAIEN